MRNRKATNRKRAERRKAKKAQVLNKVEKDVQDVVLNVSDKISDEVKTIPVVDSKGNTIDTPESDVKSIWKIIGVLTIPFIIGGAVGALMMPFI